LFALEYGHAISTTMHMEGYTLLNSDHLCWDKSCYT